MIGKRIELDLQRSTRQFRCRSVSPGLRPAFDSRLAKPGTARVYRETRKDVYRTQNGDLPSFAAKLLRKCMALPERSDHA